MTDNLVKAMLSAQADKRTGVFEVEAEGVQTLAYFAKGALVFAQGGAPSDTLGRVLVREGKLTTEQYTAVIERMASQSSQSEPKRFGEMVVELRFLKPEQVHEALAAQVRQKAVACLLAEDPEWSFQEGAEPPAGAVHFPSSVEPLALAATKLFEQDRIGRTIDLARESYPRLVSDAAATGQAFKLTGAEQRFVGRIDGATPVRQLASSGRPGSVDGAAILAALVLGGYAELCPSAKAVGGAQATPLVGAPVARVQLVSRARSANAAARSATAAAVTSTRASRLQAEEAFQKGRIHLGNNALSLARPMLRRAAELCPDAPEFALYLRWAEFLTADDQARPVMRDALKSLATQAVKQAPHLAFGFFVLGWVAMMDDQGSTATRLLRQALKLDPDLLDAERYLRAIRSKGEGPPAKPLKPVGPSGKAPRPPTAERSKAASQLALVAAKVQEALASLQDGETSKSGIQAETQGLSAAAALAVATPASFKPPTPAAFKPPAPPPFKPPGPPPFKPPGPPPFRPPTPPAFKPPAPAALEPPAPAAFVPPAPAAFEPPAPAAFEPPAPAAFEPPAPAAFEPAPSAPEASATAPARPVTLPEQAPLSPVAQPSRAAAPPAAKAPYRAWLVPGLVLAAATAVTVIVYGASSKHRAAALPLPSSEPRAPSPVEVAPIRTTQVVAPPAETSPPAPPARAAVSASPTASQPKPAAPAPSEAASAPTAPSSATSTSSSAPASPPPPKGTLVADETHGIVLTPASAGGHRIFIDGHVAGEAPTPLSVRCGTHTIKVGSGGKEEDVDVPCGGTITLLRQRTELPEGP
jgi:hypothetical protein